MVAQFMNNKEQYYDYIVIGSGFGGSLVYANTLLTPPEKFYQGKYFKGLSKDWKSGIRTVL